MGGLCDFGVTPVPIGLGFGFGTASGLGLGLRGPDLGLGLDNFDDLIDMSGSSSNTYYQTEMRKPHFLLQVVFTKGENNDYRKQAGFP